MGIDIEKAVSFIGFPATHPQLDEFLQECGVKRRLSSKDRPLASVGIDDESVHLRFTDAYQETHGAPKAKGFLFLESVTIQSSKYEVDTGKFIGTLPFGLSLDIDETEIVRLLGEPSYNGEFLGAQFITYKNVYPGINLRFRLDKKTREITFIRFSAEETA